MIVVDSTVLGDLQFNGGRLRQSARRLQEIDADWICTELVRYELGNIAWKYGRVLQVEMEMLSEGISGVEEAVREFVNEVDWREVLRISMKEGLTYYNASHVWLARDLGLELRTRDKEILKNCPDVAVGRPIGEAG